LPAFEIFITVVYRFCFWSTPGGLSSAPWTVRRAPVSRLRLASPITPGISGSRREDSAATKKEEDGRE
jgi:hypothetical protein